MTHPCRRCLRVIFVLSKKVAFSILTFSQIKYALIPEFDQLLKELEANMTEIEKKNQQERATEEKSIFEECKFLVEAKIRCTSFSRIVLAKLKASCSKRMPLVIGFKLIMMRTLLMAKSIGMGWF